MLKPKINYALQYHYYFKRIKETVTHFFKFFFFKHLTVEDENNIKA